MLKEQSRKKSQLGGFTYPIPIIKKKNWVSAQSLTMRTHNFRTLLSNIFTQTKKFAKPFLPVNMGPRQNLLSKEKKGKKSRDTVPLSLLMVSDFNDKGTVSQDFCSFSDKKIILRPHMNLQKQFRKVFAKNVSQHSPWLC